jgi:hypothetical protein
VLCEKCEKVYIRAASTVPCEVAVSRNNLVVNWGWVSSLRSSVLLGVFPCCAVVERTIFLLAAKLRSLKFGNCSLHTLLRPLQIFLDFLRR